MCAIIFKCAPRIDTNVWACLRCVSFSGAFPSCTESKRKSEVVADSALYFDMTFYSFAYSHWHSSQLIQRQSQIPAIQLPEWELNFMMLSCFLLGVCWFGFFFSFGYFTSAPNYDRMSNRASVQSFLSPSLGSWIFPDRLVWRYVHL